MFPKFDPTNQEACLAVLEDVTTNAKQIQESVLENVLSRNAQTEYLKRFLNGGSDIQSFKKNVPVINYEDFKPYIKRIVNGEPSEIICLQPTITELISSSGTSAGVPKLIPMTTEEMDRRSLFTPLSVSLLNKQAGGLYQGKALLFFFMNRDTETPGGLWVGTFITNVLRSYSDRSFLWDRALSSPLDVSMCRDTKQSMYCQLLCGLAQRDHVGRFGASFSSTFIRVIKFLEAHWRELCSNIRMGHVSEWITDIKCRTTVCNILGGRNPELADIIEKECDKKSWEGIVRRLWPKAKCIETIVTGSMAQYVPMVNFYGGGLPLVSAIYGSSECFFGINLDLLCKLSDVSYTIIPNSAYFEFLEINRNENETGHGQLVDLVDVKIGHRYEPVVTTFTGLYRYRVGDVLQATGFHNNTPMFQVVGRQKVALSIDLDKTYEEDLEKAVTLAKRLLEEHNIMLTDFTSYVYTCSFPGHYVLCWELETKLNDTTLEFDPNTLEECCFLVEESLDAVYRKYRNYKSIGPLEIKVVKEGTFDELMDFFVSRGSSVSQYKTPRSVTHEEALKILESGVVSEFFSKKTPSWKSHEIHSVQ
ncbi:PREDICTED: indole-3-acetic acid-amido synthetase GH3.17-like [Tarenaya hassleriana]|uniref:indole-3-acetic acid-amido synthetase GH3.17-like n=1 Tax=Tarenaya hassleriana TaxID=28532 RepID=UPI00053C209B|nr:PREDICTED: indole-3-acetic acid-amido synthetase GH3.17-like [Tarenaya hassleriana]